MRLANVLTAMMVAAGIGLTSGLAQPVWAQSADKAVTLKSFDGFTQLRGNLVDFDGATYTIETVLGVIDVDALQVTCEGAACPEDILFDAKFGIYGANTIGEQLMPALIEGYADSMDADMVTEVGQSANSRMLRIVNADGREMAAIDLQSSGSDSAYPALGNKAAEIGMASRRARDADIATLNQGGIPELRDTENEHILALDGLAVLTHPSNPISSISIEELALIYSGEVSNWSQIGGQDAPINLHALEDNSGTFQTFNSLVLAPYDLPLAAGTQRHNSNIRLSDTVATDRDAIGVTGIAFQRAAKALPIRQECGILSYPTTFAMKTEEYPLSRRLYLYTPPTKIAAHARRIVDFAMSDAAQPLIAEAGFVDQNVEAITMNQEGARLIHALVGEEELQIGLLQTMLRELREAERLSITFRFTPGSSLLTPKSQLDARRLARDLINGRYEGKELLLVGFTDAVGQFTLNQGLSVRRANVVLEQLSAAVPPGALTGLPITVQGYGELMPVGCNTSFQGRTVNRRVEVWLRNAG